MERAKGILRRCFRLPGLWAAALSVVSAAALVYIFAEGLDTAWFAAVAYAGAFYALTVDCVLLVPRIAAVIRWRRTRVSEGGSPLQEGRLRWSLYRHLAVDLLYGVWQIWRGASVGSAWVGGYGIYNLCHSVGHGVLVRYERRLKRMPEGLSRQRMAWRCYVVCGFLMLAVNLTMTGLAFQMVWMGRSDHYSEIGVIALAAFTFYKLTLAIIRVVRCHRNDEPISAAARNLGLAEAMMSLFSLQAALLAVYGQTLDQKVLMNSLTGFAVCLLTMLGGFTMVVYGRKRLKMVREEVHDGGE